MADKNDIAADLIDLSPYGDFFPWASRIVGRTNGTGWKHGDFKRHRTKGQAKAAIASYRGAYGREPVDPAIYHWDEDLVCWVKEEE